MGDEHNCLSLVGLKMYVPLKSLLSIIIMFVLIHSEVCTTEHSTCILTLYGKIITIGQQYYGGVCPSNLPKIQQICGNDFCFAAIGFDGSLFAWGDPSAGNNFK
jgi:hypothetical protein